MIVRFIKVISTLPGTLVANALYFVRVGAGFDLYVTDSTASIAHSLNSSGGSGLTEAQVRARAFLRC